MSILVGRNRKPYEILKKIRLIESFRCQQTKMDRPIGYECLVSFMRVFIIILIDVFFDIDSKSTSVCGGQT